MFKQFIVCFTLALLVKESVTKDHPTNPGEYTPDSILRFSTTDCYWHTKIEPKPQGTIRIAVVGDSTTVGQGASRVELDFLYQYKQTQMDGSKSGFLGYPYLLNQLLKNHNATQQYQIFNFGNDNFTVIQEDDATDGSSYKDQCEYNQLMQSNPDIVISMIGGKDSFQKKNFTGDAFVEKYTAFVKELQSMPSSPQIMLLTPIYSAASVIAEKNKPFQFNQLYRQNYNLTLTGLESWPQAQTDLATLVQKVGAKTGIPMDNIIDTEKLIKQQNTNAMSDTIHPNEHGYGILAQEIFMKLSSAEQLKERINMIFETNLNQSQWQQHIALENQQRQAAATIAAKEPKTSLIQQELGKFKIDLSQKCHDQTYVQAQEAQLPGLKFNFQIPTPKRYNEIRIAVAGDSAVQGYGATTQKQVLAESLDKRLSDQTDGSQQGLQGWPYLLHSLLQDNNQTTDYTMMNYGVQDATITPNIEHFSFENDCRYEMLKKSLPNFVFLSFGSMDSHLKNYSERQFVDSYTKLVKEAQKLPTRPMVFLMVPVSTCKHQLNVTGNEEKYASFVTNTSQCSFAQKTDMQETILKVASLTDIPRAHVINAWSMIRDPQRKESAIAQDNVHPNLKGMGEIAQDFFMKMSLSPNYLARQTKILSGDDAIYNLVLKKEFESQNIHLLD